MTPYHLTSSIKYWISTHWLTNIEWGNPAEFDEKSDSLTVWCELDVQTIGEGPARKTAKRRVDLRVVARCYSRSKTSLHASLDKASEIAELLRHEVIDVLDCNDDGSSCATVGIIQFHEPTVTEERDEDLPSWQIHQMVIEGYAQET